MSVALNKPVVKDRLRQYLRLTRMNRPIGSLLLLWPALWALWIAGQGHPDPYIVAVFVAGVFVMRSAGCVLNDFADRHVDPHVKRTRDRPLATGDVRPREALILFAVLSLGAFALVLTLNRLTVLMSFGAIVLAAIYPFMKRYTHWPQVFLGAAFGWAVPMAFAAQTASVPRVAWLLFLAAILWALVYDTLYAMVDRDDDLRIGVKSTAVLFGDADRAIVGVIQALLLGALVLVGQLSHLGPFYYLGLAVAGGLAVYQQYLIRHRDRDACFKAFLNNNWFGAVIFAGVLLHYLAGA